MTPQDPRALARIRWRAYLAEISPHAEPSEPVRFTRPELAEYLRHAWPELDRNRARLMFDFEGRAKGIVQDLAGQSPTGFWLADQVDEAAAAELERELGGLQTALF